MKSVLNKSALMTALICGSVLWGGTAAYAEEENIGEFSLDTMVVTATRTSEELLKVPASVHVITAKDIEEKNILTISDAIKTLPGIYDGRAGGMSDVANGIQMRGFGEGDILVLYDGMPLNEGYAVNYSQVSRHKKAKIFRNRSIILPPV